jgi:hypothetical protein
MPSGLKTSLVVVALLGVTLAVSACAKYPVVGNARSSAPSADARPPAR